jgi:tRNA pseudouridine38-40 synthase
VPQPGTPNFVNEPAALRRVRFVVAYEGSGFRGFAINRGVTTVVGVLGEALSLVTRHAVQLVAAGRTDAGVHGWGQVVSCDLPATTDLPGTVRRVNRLCGPQVVLRSAEWTDDDFSARFSAMWRQYRYTVLNSPVPNPFLATSSWFVHRPLSLPAMQLACDPLIGENDFTSFCRIPDRIPGAPPPSMRRHVMLARWTDVTAEMGSFTTDQRVLRFEIRANAFCHQMVRSIIGMMIDIGTGDKHAGDVRTMMRAQDRRVAARLAPAHGLMLWEVGYPD